MPAWAIEDVFLEPEHVRITLQGYERRFEDVTPEILVYPVEGDPNGFEDAISFVGSLTPGTSLDSRLPYWPAGALFSAPRVLVAQAESKAFGGSTGVRYLTEFRQDMGAPRNGGVLYTYQGVTIDGRFWIAVNAPISHPTLDDGGGGWPDWISWDQWCITNFEACIADATEDLNSQAPDSFAPSLELLDALVASITVTP